MKTKEILSKLLADLSKSTGVPEKNIKISLYENSSGVKWTLEEFFSNYNPEEIDKGHCHLQFKVDLTSDDGAQITICAFQLRDMYHCSGIMVATDLYVHVSNRSKGIGTIITKFIMDFSSYYGHGMVQANDKLDNDHQIKTFEKLGWKIINTFRNPKTKNEINVWSYNLN